jgi:hypothetical protein
MKKLIVIAFMLLSFVSNVSAEPAPAAWLWEVEYVISDLHPEWEDVYGSQTSTVYDHGGNMNIVVLVVGYSSTMVTTFNGSALSPWHIQALDPNNDGTIDAWRYYYSANGQSGTVQVNDFGVKDSLYIK